MPSCLQQLLISSLLRSQVAKPRESVVSTSSTSCCRLFLRHRDPNPIHPRKAPLNSKIDLNRRPDWVFVTGPILGKLCLMKAIRSGRDCCFRSSRVPHMHSQCSFAPLFYSESLVHHPHSSMFSARSKQRQPPRVSSRPHRMEPSGPLNWKDNSSGALSLPLTLEKRSAGRKSERQFCP